MCCIRRFCSVPAPAAKPYLPSRLCGGFVLLFSCSKPPKIIIASKLSLILLAFCGFWGITAPFRFWQPQKSVIFIPRNCPHCGQKWTARRRKASGLSPASPLAASPSAEIRLQPFFFCVCRVRNAPARWRNVRFSGAGRVRARLSCESRTNRRHGRDGL